MTQTLNLTLERPSGYDPAYPAPPRVHWAVLLIAFWGSSWLIFAYAPVAYQDLLTSLVADAWAFYLCRWIHSINPEAKSPLWCDIYLVAELVYAGLSVWQNPPRFVALVIAVLALASVVLAIATIWLIKGDLEKHYNEREPVGLVLNGFMTIFGSFIYFQSHLYRIAKEKQAQSLANLDPSQTPSS